MPDEDAQWTLQIKNCCAAKVLTASIEKHTNTSLRKIERSHDTFSPFLTSIGVKLLPYLSHSPDLIPCDFSSLQQSKTNRHRVLLML